MSIGPTGGIAGSVAGSPLAQTTGSDVEKTRQDVSAQQRKVQSDKKAEAAAGIGETDGENHETNERDADGRRLWELPPEGEGGETDVLEDNSHKSKDPSGQSGTQLDLSG